MAIAVDTDWFNGCYERAVNALGDVGRLSSGAVNIDSHSSETGKELVAEYGHLRVTLASMLNTMACDWNAARVCVTNLVHFDKYISHLVKNEPTNHMEYGCDALWHSGGADDTHLIVSGNALTDHPGSGNYISSEYIDGLSILSDKLDSMEDAIGEYLSAVEELASCADYSGLTFDSIKSYMSRVHAPIARSIRAVFVTFSGIIRYYREIYSATMRDDTYLYDRGHLEVYRGRLRQSYRELRDKIAEFNSYVHSKNSEHEELGLDSIMHYCIDNVEQRVDLQINEIDEIIETIETNETNGKRDTAMIKGYIDLLDDVVADLGMHSGYRMISPTRRFDSISPLGNICAYPFDVCDLYLRMLQNGNALQRQRAEEFLRNDIRANLIESFQGRDTVYYHYDMYEGYDVNVLSSMINELDLNDMDLVRSWRMLHSAMLADGYTDLRARRYSEIAVLFNREGVLGYSNQRSDIDDVITKGIQNYVVDYAGYITDNDAYGYNQAQRWGGRKEFDCSSFIIAAYEKAFIDLRFAMNQFPPEADPEQYLHIGSNKLSYTPLDRYGFTIYKPNENITVNELNPGDVFAIDNEFAEHVEMFAGKFEDGERVEYLNFSAHSSERISGEGEHTNGYADEAGDQLHQWGPERIRRDFVKTPWSTFIYETACVGEEGGSYDAEGNDVWGHDRIGEIRYENIGPRPEWGHDEHHITGCIKWPTYNMEFDDEGNEIPEQRHYNREERDWNRILRLENMDYWKTDHY